VSWSSRVVSNFNSLLGVATVIRDDLSNRLVHLTKGATELEAANNFESIVQTKTLRGGTGLIHSGNRCVCFSEAPISKLATILSTPSGHAMPYAPFGVMLEKSMLFAAGGRPVIYQPNSEYDFLHHSQRYRHKEYDPIEAVDYSWEREWRILADEFPIDPAKVTLVVPNRVWADHFYESHAGSLRGVALVVKDLAPFMIGKSPWHFIVLEDIGISIAFACVP
jgi:hypothetical protein